MTEKNILAFFQDSDEAEKAAARIRELGVIDYRVDRIGRFPGDGIEQVMNPITSQIESQARMTMGLNVTGPDTGVLMAADPSASGMSDGGNEMVKGHDILLTVIVDESRHHEALRLLREAGAYI